MGKGMTTETLPERVNVGEFAGQQFLMDLDRAERGEFYKLLDEAPWGGKPSEFVLSTYQRVRSGSVAGDAALGERIRYLLFKI